MTIQQVSEKLNISTDTLRYYEKIGLIFKVPRTHGGIRAYGETEIKNVEFVKCMRDAGISIDALVNYMKLLQEGAGTESARKEILISEREKLKENIDKMQNAYNKLNYKIELYDSIILGKEQELIKKENKNE